MAIFNKHWMSAEPDTDTSVVWFKLGDVVSVFVGSVAPYTVFVVSGYPNSVRRFGSYPDLATAEQKVMEILAAVETASGRLW